MSSSSPVPGNAAPTDMVWTEHSSRDGSHNKSRPWSQNSRSNSASLLTRALATQKEADRRPCSITTSHSSPEVSTDPLRQSSPPPDKKPNNGLKPSQRAEVGADTMAAVAPASASIVAGATSRGNTPISSTFTFHDMTQFHGLLANHPNLLNGSRGRGTSLERTEKEKRVEGSPKGTFSTNPGDTALPPSPEAISSMTLDSNNPPTEGVRATYRSWRDVRPGMASEKAWSIGEQGSDGSQGQVEKSITEAMTGAEPNNRSRKASHSLRFFKEGLPEDTSKKRDGKSRARSKDGSSLYKGDAGKQKFGQEASIKESVDTEKSVTQDRQSPFQSPVEQATSMPMSAQTSNDPNPTTGLAAQEGYFDASHNVEIVTEEQVKAMPVQLLAEIRKHHNLTPGAAKGSSFSRSIPVTVSERPKYNAESLDPNPSEAIDNDIENDNNQDDTGSSQIKSNDEEDESGEEQISSALFVPHHTSLEPLERHHHGLETAVRPRLSDRDSSKSQQWLEEHKVPPREAERKHLNQESHTRPLVVPSSSYIKQEASHAAKDLSNPIVVTPKTYHEITDDEDATTAGEESSVTDTLDTTPAGSLNSSNQIPSSYGKSLHDHRNDHKEPLEAIELIPYRHQVGGHTTIWRFSKRAVCKQLNNRENEFYEKVEHYHPQLLKFLPRYIGVLNVTFEKQTRRKSPRKDDADGAVERQDIAQDVEEAQAENKASYSIANGEASANTQADQPRVISQSLHSTLVPIPTVTFADNRHIIPKSFMQPHPRLIDAELRSKSDSDTMVATLSKPELSTTNLSAITNRPALSDKHAASWGATTVNKQLRNQVFGEAFLQQPIPIQRHKRPASQHRSLPSRHAGSGLRPSNSESSLKAAQQSQTASNAQMPEKSVRRRAVKAAAERRNGLTPLTSIEQNLCELKTNADEEQAEFDTKAGRSAPEPEIAHSLQGKRQRRYSSGGLRRKPAEVADDRGNLKYFEEADDAGYKGDVDDDVFPIDLEPSQQPTWPSGGSQQLTRESIRDENTSSTDLSKRSTSTTPRTATHEPLSSLLGISRPVNPKEAQTQPDSRVEYFLLLEDLTAGMTRPCIMDLKMGTRQYGVDSNEKKQKSQRRKCEATTSKELGVRVCGLQVWDVKTQSYVFQDKYFGRDLKVGREFQDALTRFLYDGVDYASVLRHIPTILAKLSRLEILIQGLAGYRFYAASLLLFYDGDTQGVDESDSTATEKDMRQRNEIDFKIADFANCVTKEDFRSGEKPCPPRHPDQPDKGFLRGLRSLKSYFLAIQKEIWAKEMGRKQDKFRNGHDGAMYEDIDDEDGISY